MKLLLVSLILVIGVFLFPPIHQDLMYHDFADKRAFFGVANFLDVISNALFILFGLMGLAALKQVTNIGEKVLWAILFFGAVLVGVGSGYYHLSPNNETLVWDRLPMTIVFMSFFSLMIMERVGEKFGLILAPLLLIVGVESVLYWQSHDDLRLYALVQFLPIVIIPLLIWSYPAKYSGLGYLVMAIGWYALAKILEYCDKAIFSLTEHTVSGHTLKHLASAMAIFSMILYVKKRLVLPARDNSRSGNCDDEKANKI